MVYPSVVYAVSRTKIPGGLKNTAKPQNSHCALGSQTHVPSFPWEWPASHSLQSLWKEEPRMIIQPWMIIAANTPCYQARETF